MKCKRLLCLLLVCVLLACVPVTGALAAPAGTMAFTDDDLARDDNVFTYDIRMNINSSTPGSNNYAAQAFVASADYVTGCRLNIRLGDNAVMTIQIRDALYGDEESILYAGNYPMVADPHDFRGWWEYTFTRPVQLEKGKTYYLMYWCDTYHSWCFAGSTQYVVDGLTNTSYRMPDGSFQWQALYQRSYGYELLSDPDAEITGYPYAVNDNELMLHPAEEYFGFARKGENTQRAIDGDHASQGYYSMQIAGGAKDEDGAVFSAYVDFDEDTNLTAYSLLYVDLLVSRDVTEDLTLSAALLDEDGRVGRVATRSIQGFEKGWHRLAFSLADMTPVRTGNLTYTRQLALKGLGETFPDDLYLCFDNLRVAKQAVAAFTDGYYTEQELAQPSPVDDGVSYIGKPAADQPDTRYGDVNMNDKVDATDALLVLRCSVGKVSPSADQFKAGDVDGNNQLTAVDALYILQYAVGKITRFPVEASSPVPPPPSDPEPAFHVTAQGLQPNTQYHITTTNLGRSKYMAHDVVRLVSSLQGLLNRDMAQNHVALVIDDKYSNIWIPYLQENDTVLQNLTNRVDLRSVDELLTVFEAQLQQCGLILWDTDAPSTANVAATICGLDGYLPVKYDLSDGSLYHKLMEMNVPVRQNLVGLFTGKGLIPGTSLLSTGSKKCDPYLWALEKYAGRCSTHYLMYVPDGSSATVGNLIYEGDPHSKSVDYNKLYNHDYGIYRQAFFFDLTPIDIEAPCDDPTQPLGTDLATLREILLNRYCRDDGRFGEVVGFPPWALKYATHNNWGSVEATSVEAAFTNVITQYNCYLDADGSIADCSLYAQFTLDDHYESVANAKPVTEEFDQNTMYLYLYTGDYDSSPWVLEHLYRCYNDPARGSIPITWSFTPSLSDRIPMVFDYLYKNQTDNDYFNAADSGVGYIRPQALFQSESDRTLPDGDKEFIRINKQYFAKFDLDSVGFIIGKLSDKVCRTYNQFAPVGSGTNDNSGMYSNYAGTPYMWFKNGIGNPATTEAAMTTAVSEMYAFAKDRQIYNGAGFRTITFTASELKSTQEAFLAYAAEKDPDTTYKFVDYKTFFAMLTASAAGRYTLD